MLARSLARRGARSRALARVVTARPLDVDGDGTPRAKTTTMTSRWERHHRWEQIVFRRVSRVDASGARARRGTRVPR